METTICYGRGRVSELRAQLVRIALEWEALLGVAPSITSAISELDAAMLVGMNEADYCAAGQGRSAVTKDVDFEFNGVRYQVTANRPSGRKGSAVTLVSQKNELKRPFGWDRIIWLLYDKRFVLQEAWEFSAVEYRARFSQLRRLSPGHMRQGRQLTVK